MGFNRRFVALETETRLGRSWIVDTLLTTGHGINSLSPALILVVCIAKNKIWGEAICFTENKRRSNGNYK